VVVCASHEGRQPISQPLRQGFSGVLMHTQQLQARAVHNKRLKEGGRHLDQLYRLPRCMQVITGRSAGISLCIDSLRLGTILAVLRTSGLVGAAEVYTSISAVARSASGIAAAVLSAAQYEIHCMTKLMA
jgi:hypothetical protein